MPVLLPRPRGLPPRWAAAFAPSPWTPTADGGEQSWRWGHLFELSLANPVEVVQDDARPRWRLHRDHEPVADFEDAAAARAAADRDRAVVLLPPVALHLASQLGLFGPVADVRAHVRHAAGGRLAAVAQHQRHTRPGRGKLLELFAHVGAPQPGEKGHKIPTPEEQIAADDAAAMLESARTFLGEPEAKWAWDWAVSERDGIFTDGDGYAWDDEQPQAPDFTLEELAGVPYKSPGGRDYTAEERRNLALLAFDLAMGEDGRGDPGDTWQVGGTGEHAHRMGRGFELPRWAAEAVMADALLPRAKLRLVPVSREVAADFIKRHHSALPEINPRGLLFAVGVARGTRLVGVATCNTPTGRFDDPSGIVELTRVASDGTVKGAASKLVSRVLDVWARAARSAPRKLVTYSLTSEDGTTYKALADKGLRPVVFVHGRAPSGARSGGAHEDAALARLDKIRWEAGPDAGPADWSLIE